MLPQLCCVFFGNKANGFLQIQHHEIAEANISLVPPCRLCSRCRRSRCVLLLPEGNAQYGQQQEPYQQGPPQQQGYPPQQQYPGQQAYPPQQQGYGESDSPPVGGAVEPRLLSCANGH